MIVPVAIVVVVGCVGLARGGLAPLADVRVRRWWLVAVAIAVQVLVIEVLPSTTPRGLSVGLHLGSYAAALGFVWLNRSWSGILVLGAGGLLNLAVASANGGVMPASAAAVERAGIEHDAGFQNSAPVDDPVLSSLGDVFAIPGGLPLANVFSLGDVLVVAGAGLVADRACRKRRATPSAGEPAAPARTS